MRRKRGRTTRVGLVLLTALLLLAATLLLAGCGEDEGAQARATVDQAGENAADFAEGFCGAIILAPLGVVVAVAARRTSRD